SECAPSHIWFGAHFLCPQPGFASVEHQLTCAQPIVHARLARMGLQSWIDVLRRTPKMEIALRTKSCTPFSSAGFLFTARLLFLAVRPSGWYSMDLTLIVVLVIALALFFDFTNGFHDTANAMATPIATGAISPKKAVALAAILNLVGAFLSTEVAKTISGGIINEDPTSGVAIGPAMIF